MWYENVYMQDEQYDSWAKKIFTFKVSELYSKLPELKNATIVRMGIKSNEEDFPFPEKSKTFLSSWIISIKVPMFPENLPEQWINENIKSIICTLKIEFTDYVTMNCLLNNSLKSDIDIIQNEDDKYVITIKGGIEAEFIVKEKPYVSFSPERTLQMLKENREARCIEQKNF
jgi:hypothetical protein